MNKNTEKMFAEYLESLPEKRELLRNKLIESGVNIDKLETLYQQMDQIPVPEPGPEMTENFYQMLNNEKRALNNQQSFTDILFSGLRHLIRNPITVRIAYSLCMILLGWFIGFKFPPQSGAKDSQLQYLSAELTEMKKMVAYSMLNQPSPSERIKAIHYIKSSSTVDESTISALMHVLNYDENTNVRLVCLEVLMLHTHRERVKNGLFNSLSRQKSPLVQITLAKSLLSLEDEEAAARLKELLQKKDLNFTVRNQIEKSLKSLI